MTRPPPWWAAHLAGLILLQAAYWYGVTRYYHGGRFLDSILVATYRPAGPACVTAVVAAPLLLVVLGTIWHVGPVESPWWRWAWVVVVYTVAAVWWCLAVGLTAS